MSPFQRLPKWETPKSSSQWRTSIWSTLKSTLTSLTTLLPSPLLHLISPDPSKTSHPSHQSTAYLDGIRGLAALTVYIQHYSAPFQPGQIGDANRESGKWSIFQYPIIRLFYSGSFAVALFFVISGFALSRKPLHLRYYASAHHDDTKTQISKALLSLSSATFRRGIRIFIPPIVIVFLTMLGTHLHLFDSAPSILPETLTEKYNVSPPTRLPTFSAQLLDCLYYIAAHLIYPSQWMRAIPGTKSANYGFQLWTIPMEFWASLVVFSVLGALVPVKSRGVRNGGIALVILYAFWCSRWEISLFLSGLLLADLDLFLSPPPLPAPAGGPIIPLTSTSNPSPTPNRPNHTTLNQLLPPTLWTLTLLTGLYLGSTPEMNAATTPGFTTLTKLTPHEETWHSLGAVLVILTISRCRLLQKPLTTSLPQYLGRISFGLYLVHVPVLMWVGWTATPGLWGVIGREGAVRYETGVVVGCLGVLVVVGWVADVFWRVVDAPCVRLGRVVEGWVFGVIA